MKRFFAYFLLCPLLAFSANVTYCNFECGLGYLDSGSRYIAHGTGNYVTVPASVASSVNWNTGWYGAETIIGGQKNNTTFSHYTALIFRGNFLVPDTFAAVPLAQGVPYSGGSAPLSGGNSGFNLNGNTPIEGAWDANFNDGSGNGSGLFNDNSVFTAYNENGDPVVYSVVRVDGHDYLSTPFVENPSIPVPVDDVNSIPVYYKNDSGDLVSGFYNSSTGQFSPASGSGSGGDYPTVDTSSIVNAINNQGSLTRSQLVDLLGSSGQSWVYDCKLSLSDLYSLASNLGLVVRLSSADSSVLSSINSTLQQINSKDFSPSVNIDLSGVRSDLADLKSYTEGLPYALSTRLSTMQLYQKNLPTINSRLLSIYNILDSWDTGNTLGVLPQPDFGDDSPDDNLPSYISSAWSNDGFASEENNTLLFGSLVDWGDNGAPTMLIPDFISSFLTSFVGQIPSVGSDPVMFDVDFELPFIGHIQKRFSWADYPYISDFRALLVWLLYLFFGLACFKLLHKTFI